MKFQQFFKMYAYPKEKISRNSTVKGNFYTDNKSIMRIVIYVYKNSLYDVKKYGDGM